MQYLDSNCQFGMGHMSQGLRFVKSYYLLGYYVLRRPRDGCRLCRLLMQHAPYMADRLLAPQTPWPRRSPMSAKHARSHWDVIICNVLQGAIFPNRLVTNTAYYEHRCIATATATYLGSNAFHPRSCEPITRVVATSATTAAAAPHPTSHSRPACLHL